MPKTLRPIFRDREDFSAGHSLTEQTLAALEASQFLIVLCSPNAAQSKYVNEEVRRFKALGRGDRVIPVIVDGEPGDPERECFPPALRFKLGPDGTDHRRARGTDRGRRAAARRRQGASPSTRWWPGSSASASTRSCAAPSGRAGGATGSGQRSRACFSCSRSPRAAAPSMPGSSSRPTRRSSTPRSSARPRSSTRPWRRPRNTTCRAPRRSSFSPRPRACSTTWRSTAGPTPELRYRKAWMLIQFARNYEILGDTGKQFARAIEAHRLLAGLAAEKPNDMTYQRDLSVAYDEIGDVLVAQGNLPEALKSYRDGLAIGERLAKADPSNAGWQRDLSVSYEKVGDVLVAQGNLTEALKSYRDGLAIRERLAKADPSNTRLAARSVGVLRQGRRRAGGAGQPCRGAANPTATASPSRAAGEGRPRQRRLAARSVGVATTRSATCWWRRAICRRR